MSAYSSVHSADIMPQTSCQKYSLQTEAMLDNVVSILDGYEYKCTHILILIFCVLWAKTLENCWVKICNS